MPGLDAPVVPNLLNQIPATEGIGGVTADGAGETRKYGDAIGDRRLNVIIPPRENTKL